MRLFLLSIVLPFCLIIKALGQPSADDNEAWKQRCDTLNENRNVIESGQIPAGQAAAVTQGVSGARFEAFARERSDKGQHFTACGL